MNYEVDVPNHYRGNIVNSLFVAVIVTRLANNSSGDAGCLSQLDRQGAIVTIVVFCSYN